MKAEELKGEASVRKGEKQIMVQLVGEERESVVKEVTAADARKIKIETEKAYKTKLWNEEIKNEETIMHQGCLKLDGGVLRKVETREYFFWSTGKVVVVRSDTGEILDERSISADETFEDLFDKSEQFNPEDAPEEFKQRLLSFIPKVADPLALQPPVKTECKVIDEELPRHLCAECVHCDEQPGCRDRLTKGEILFNDDNPDAEVLECVRFEPIPEEGDGLQQLVEEPNETQDESSVDSNEAVAHGRKKKAKKRSKKAA